MDLSKEYSEYKGIRPGLDIAIIGTAGRFPGAKNIQEFWNNLKNGVESIAFFSDHELIEAGVSAEELKMTDHVKAKGVLEDIEYFDSFFFGYSPGEAEKMDPQIRILHECAWHALEDAGYDPYGYEGVIGLYVGAQNNFHWQARVFLAGSASAADAFNSLNLVDKDHISTRIAYKLNLTGPTFSLVTQCSTSLVGLHQACQGLMSGDCDMALAGGISITLPQKAGYHYQEGMIYSSDGHLRAFAARGNGTVFGNGVGIVVLKTIEEAIADGDHITAVIKSSFVNNDGNRKVGYTAPSVEGQAEAIGAALELAGVEPGDIGYVEAHGTATALGDAIEIEALKLAFNTDKKHFCRIGTVKTNIGHLENASGAAGLIKAALALKHRLIPPSLHFETPNPEIDFENSPFIVNRELTTWKSDGHPLRAGVSSFGIGGTNAHVVLEEFPQGTGGLAPLSNTQSSRQYQLILLSAQTETALDKMTENLTEYLKKNLLNPGNHENPINPGPILADAAYTLQVGRRGFKYRRSLVCRSIEDAVGALTRRQVPHQQLPSTGKAPRVHVQTFFNRNDNRSLFFMFPGLGSQYVDMGRELYEQEPVFREEMNRCFAILNTLVDYDIKEILYPSTTLNRSNRSYRSNINQTEITQPVVFAFEYALARLIMSWGIRPHGMIGYSFGEYTAACISGVFSLEDALRLIVYRGQLIRETAEGAMLSVPAPAAELTGLLPPDLYIAVDNGPSCIVSGLREAVEAFEEQLKKKKYLCMRLDTVYAIHSPVMESILEKFREKIRRISLNKPQIPYISNVTGQPLTDQEALAPAYWSGHLGNTVRFADGIKELVKEPGAVFIEIGPARDLSTLVLRYFREGQDQHVVNLVRHPQKNIPDTAYLLNKLGLLWLYGVPIMWPGFYAGEKRCRIPLPGYPFTRERYWFEDNSLKNSFSLWSQSLPAGKNPDITDWFYLRQWERSQLLSSPCNDIPTAAGKATPYCLVFTGESDFCRQLVKQLQQEGRELILVEKGPNFSQKDKQHFILDPGQSDHYHALMDELRQLNKIPFTIVHLWSIGQNNYKELSKETIADAQAHGLYSLLYLARALSKKGFTGKIRITVITNHVHEVLGDEVLFPGKATVTALAKTIQQEIVNIKCQCIDIVPPDSPGPGEKKLLEQLSGELSADSPDTVIAFRGNYRWVETYKPVRLEKINREPLPLKEQGVYLITGGLGNVGFILARYLARTFKAKLILTGRTLLPPRARWEEYLAAHDRDNHHERKRICTKIRKVLELEKLGGQVLVFSTDIADERQMRRVIVEAEAQLGSINGIIHAAGTRGGDSAQAVDKAGKKEFERHFQGKIYGVLVLEKLFRGKKIDFCLLISSPASILGGLGFAAYAAANIFVDAFVYWFNRTNSTPWLTVNWADWELQEEEIIHENDLKRGYVEEMLMTPEEGVETFRRILEYDRINHVNQVVVSAGNFQERIDKWVKLESMETHGSVNKKEPGSLKPRPNLMEPYVPPGNPTEEILANTWKHFFGFEKVGINDDFFDLGGDSLKAITIISIIHKESDIQIPLEKFFFEPTIKKLARYISTAQKSQYLAIEAVEKREYYPLSSAQKRLYVLQQLEKDNIVYNETIVSLLEGQLDRKKFQEALTRLTRRHEILRTSFPLINGEPVQKILPELKAQVHYFEIKEEEADEVIGDFIKSFNLTHPPFFRIGVLKIAERKNILVRDMHHIITDGVSTELFTLEFMAYFTAGGKGLGELKLQYKDYTEWQRTQKEQTAMKHQEEYWRKEYEGGIPLLRLPIDYERPELQCFNGDIVNFELDSQETQDLKKMALEEDVTLYMVLLAVLNVFLSRISSQEDIVIGTSAAGRRHADLQYIMGPFVNTVAIRNYPRKTLTFSEFLAGIKEKALKSFENQDLQFEDLIEILSIPRDMSRNPLFDVQFVLQNQEVQPLEKEIPKQESQMQLKHYPFENKISKFDLRLDVRDADGQLFFLWEFRTKLFKRETIRKFADYFKEIISRVIENRHVKLGEISITHHLFDSQSNVKEEDYSEFNF